MVPRYTRPEMEAIWAPANRYRIWFEIEALAAEGMAEIGAIPESAARNIREKGGAKVAAIGPADIERIDAIERETRHDVIAFLTWLGRGDRRGQPLRAPGHDQFRRAGHLPVGAAHPGRGPAAGGPRRGAGGAEGARARAQIHA